MRRSRILAMAMAATLALGLSACGGDDDDDSSDASSSEATEDDSSASSDDDTGDDTSDDGGDDNSDDLTEEELDEIEEGMNLFTSEECSEAYAAFLGVAAAAFGDTGEGQEGLEQLEAYAENAPEEIREDLQTWYQGYADFLEAMGDGGVPDLDALEDLNDEEFVAAGERVGEWLQNECGLEE